MAAQSGTRALEDLAGRRFFYYKPPTCVRQLFATDGEAVRDDSENSAGALLFYYKPPNSSGEAGRHGVEDFACHHFFFYQPHTCVLQLSETHGHAGTKFLKELAGDRFLYYKPVLVY